MLRVEHASVSYGPHRALEDVSVRVEPGEIVVILGANGAGKSTLLRAIAGILRTAPGASVAIDDRSLVSQPANRIVEAGIALVPEGRGIFGDLTVAENLALGAYGRQARSGSEARLHQVLQLFPKLAERRGQVARTMSGGEQQMVAIGRALMSNPKILMLDEPSLGLSPLLSGELFRALKAIGETGVGILLVEQNARQSLAIADRAYLLETGRIVGEGRAAAMLDDPAVQKAYLGGGAPAHRPFGFEPLAMPMAPAAPATIEGMVERATQIHRAHVRNEHRRQINGPAPQLHITHARSNGPAAVATGASAVSVQAADFAERARSILLAYIEATRAVATRPPLALPPPSGVVIEPPPKVTEKARKPKKK